MNTMLQPNDVSKLEALLGDPWQALNASGFSAVVAADERHELLAAGESLLDQYQLNAQFVPLELGGRLVSLNQLIAVMRCIFRRDPSLGLGYGASSFLAAVNVWTAGHPRQQARVAEVLLSNGKLACAYHELEHGNDISRVECSAQLGQERLTLQGGKQVIANAARAQALLVYARTASGTGGRSHSQILFERTEAPAASLVDQPRYSTSGMRGIALGGLEFKQCDLPLENLVGNPGQGLETTLKAFQLTRVALPGMFSAILDTGLRLTMKHCRARKLYNKPASELPQVRARLAESFIDLLLCDAFVSVTANAAHVLPAELNLYGSAVKALVPAVLVTAMDSLASVLGAHSYVREGEMAIFQKLLRDLQPVGFGHAARISCLMTLLPQLPMLAKTGWNSAAPAPEGLFELDWQQAPLRFDRLALSSGGQDTLLAFLLTLSTHEAPKDRCESEIFHLVRLFADELRALREQCAALPAQETTARASPESFRLASRYSVLLCASACLGIWQTQQEHTTDPFLAQPAWILAALLRLAALSGLTRQRLSAALSETLLDELMQRYLSRQSFDLSRLPLAATTGWH
ncbi:acyl-CoA/acyl-ACP dehydrogenase [Pseudomonas chlororaphis]|nr:acyl-CoA/acyl-ACP dehydrogenase [Pseudomonas chlororaphis]